MNLTIMNNRINKIAKSLLAVVVMGCSLTATAQKGNVLKGRVLNADGEPVVGAVVNVAEDNKIVLTDENGFFTSVDGEYRVYGVKVLDKESGEYRDLDLNKKYVLAGFNYHLLAQGDGMAMFKDAKLIDAEGTLDIELLENYIVDHLGGTIGNQYAEPQGRITFTEGYAVCA
jgi:ribosomal protein S4E